MDRRRRSKEADMAAPEAPLCYVGVARDSAAFRLMKQMVVFSSLFLILSNFKATIFTWRICLCFFVVLYRVGKKEKGLAKTSKESKDMLESKTNKTLLVCVIFFILFLIYNIDCLVAEKNCRRGKLNKLNKKKSVALVM